MDIVYIFGAKYLFISSIFISAIWLLRLTPEIKRQVLMLGGASGILAFILSRIASYFYYDPRPFVVNNTTPLIPHATDNGFPSDHMLLVSLIAAVVSFFNPKIGVWLWCIAVLVGFSRVLVSVHHIVDIFGSICIVLFSTAVVFLIQKKLMNVILRSIK